MKATARKLPLASIALVFAACGGDEPLAPASNTNGERAGEASQAQESAANAPWFIEDAAARGIDFHHVSGHADAYLMPEIMGGGVALSDLDDDGDLDVYLVQSGTITAPAAERPPNRLYANDGGARFRDMTEASGAGDRGYGMGVAVGDVDEDGDPDLYVTNVGPDALLVNDGVLRFHDASAPLAAASAGWSTSAAFLDHDADGDLDLYVCSYIVWSPETEIPCTNTAGSPDYCSPKSYLAPAPDVFYENRGAGELVDVSEAIGIRTTRGNGLGVGCADFDGDGWTDVLVANDGTAGLLWHNVAGARFEDVGVRAGVATDADGSFKAGMGVAIGDLDDDADPDLIVCNLSG